MEKTYKCLDDKGRSHCQGRGRGPEEGCGEWEGGPFCVLLGLGAVLRRPIPCNGAPGIGIRPY